MRVLSSSLKGKGDGRQPLATEGVLPLPGGAQVHGYACMHIAYVHTYIRTYLHGTASVVMQLHMLELAPQYAPMFRSAIPDHIIKYSESDDASHHVM